MDREMMREHQELKLEELRIASRIAERFIQGNLGLVETCQQIASIGAALSEPVFFPFVAVELELEDFPFGLERKFWAEGALKHKDEELAAYVRRNQEQVLEFCRELIARADECESTS